MIRPWSFIRVGTSFFQIYDDGMNNGSGPYISNLEYDFSLQHNKYGKIRTVDDVSYVRFGLGVSLSSLANSPYSRYYAFAPHLTRNVLVVQKNDVDEVLDLTIKAEEVCQQKVRTDPTVREDFMLVKKILAEGGIDVSKLGVEGSLLTGLTNPESDLDLVLYSQETYKIFLDYFTTKKDWSSRIELFCNSSFGRSTIYKARKHYSLLSESEMIFHESRKPTGFIKTPLGHRKFSIVGLLETNDILRKESVLLFHLDKCFKKIGTFTVQGKISSDTYAPFRPSFYQTEKCTIIDGKTELTFEQFNNITYIVDYLGNFYMHCKAGEKFECRATLEELIIENKKTGEYRLSLNHWDDHLKEGFYFKTILD